jgi:hypothetical protein
MCDHGVTGVLRAHRCLTQKYDIKNNSPAFSFVRRATLVRISGASQILVDSYTASILFKYGEIR